MTEKRKKEKNDRKKETADKTTKRNDRKKETKTQRKQKITKEVKNKK